MHVEVESFFREPNWNSSTGSSESMKLNSRVSKILETEFANSQTPKTKLSNKNVLDNLEILYTNADGLLTKDMNFRF